MYKADGAFPQIGEVVTTIPTIGFNVESVTYKNLNFNVWVCRPLLSGHVDAAVSDPATRIWADRLPSGRTGDATTRTRPL